MIFKIGYYADGTWSYETFNKLINDYEIIISFICVRYDSKDKTLKNYAKQYGIDYLKHENINANEFISIIEKYNCDLFVSMSFNQIFKTKIIGRNPFSNPLQVDSKSNNPIYNFKSTSQLIHLGKYFKFKNKTIL